MLRFLREYRQKKEFAREFSALLAEAKGNLEQYYVMFQLGRLRFFLLGVLENSGGGLESVRDSAVEEYVRRLKAYNQVLKEYKDFEAWYNADLERKNQDNGRILHKKKELAQEQFAGLEQIIKAAVSSLQNEKLRRRI